MLYKLSKIKSELSWSLLGNIVYAISQWSLVTIIARYGTELDLGLYSIGLAITAPIVLFFSFDLRTLLVTERNKGYNFPEYFGGRILHVTISYAVIIPVAIVYSDNLNAFIVILLMGLVKYFEALSDICMGYFQKTNRIDLIGKSQLYRGVYTIVIVGSLYILTKNIIVSIGGLLIVMILRFILYDVKHLKMFVSVYPIFGKSSLGLMKMALPLGVTALISSLNTNIPRYFLDYFSGIGAVGVYSALYYVLIASNMLITPIALLAAPRLARAYESQNKSIMPFVKLNLQLLAFSFFAFLIIYVPILLQGENILGVLYGKSFAIYKSSFLIISISLLFGFWNAFLRLSVITAREIKIQPIINILVLLVTIIFGYLLIDTYNIIGAAWTVLISRFVQFFLYLLLFLTILRKKQYT